MFATSLTACTVSAQASGPEVPIAAGQHTKHGCFCHALQADANLVRHVAAFSGFAFTGIRCLLMLVHKQRHGDCIATAAATSIRIHKSCNSFVCRHHSVCQAQLTFYDAEKVAIMQKLCTEEPWPTQPWGNLKEQRRISTNGRKLSQTHQPTLKHRYGNYTSCTQSKKQSKSSNLKTFLAANNDSCGLHWREG